MGIEINDNNRARLMGLGDFSITSALESAGGAILGSAITQSGIGTQIANQTSAAATKTTTSLFNQYKWEFILGGILALVILGVVGYAIWASGSHRNATKD